MTAVFSTVPWPYSVTKVLTLPSTWASIATPAAFKRITRASLQTCGALNPGGATRTPRSPSVAICTRISGGFDKTRLTCSCSLRRSFGHGRLDDLREALGGERLDGVVVDAGLDRLHHPVLLR